MKPTLVTSFLGIIVFSTIIYYGFKYASGKWNVSRTKKEDYHKWVRNHGKTVEKSIIVISIIWGIGMAIQVLSLLSDTM